MFPSPLAMLALTLGVLTLTLISVNLAMLFPIWRIAQMEPGTALKEW